MFYPINPVDPDDPPPPAGVSIYFSETAVIFEANATNRVMILIGKTYAVQCGMPVEIVGKSDEEIETWTSGGVLMIEWPVWFEYVSARPPLLMASPLLGSGSGNGGTTIRVHPLRMGGGDYSWEDDFCCYSFAADGAPVFNCEGNCGCGGCYTGDITYRIGEHELAYGGWSCGCSHEPDDPHGGEEPPDGPPAGPSVSATFSHGAIIFEDEYENCPGVFVPRRSTEVEVEFYVYGGTNGGSYAFTLTDGGRLRRLGGSYVPRNGTVKAGEDFHIKVRYDAISASGSEGDIKAKVEFTENGSGRKISNEAGLTAVKVQVVAEANFPTNRNRHRFGPGEEVKIFYTPGVSGLHTLARNGLIMEESLGFVKYECPHTVRTSGVGVSLASVEFDIGFSVVAPIGYQIYQIATNSWANIGQSGGFVMEFYGYVLPRDVSFEKLQIMEVPMISTDPYGYYAQDSKTNLWNHGNHGAGEWSDVMSENRMYDMAVMEINEKPWLDGGYFTWPVPNVWRVAADHDVQNEFCNTDQRFELFTNGKSELAKFGFCGSRMTNNVFTITRSGD